MTAQARLRRRIAALERRQAQRIELVAEKKVAMDLLVANRQLEIDNLKTQVTIAVSPQGAAVTGVVA